MVGSEKRNAAAARGEMPEQAHVPENASTLHPISAQVRAHHSETFARYGANARGVNWYIHDDTERGERGARLRYDLMLAVIPDEERRARTDDTKPSVLDVGCGYGGLYERACSRNIPLAYTGVDLVSEMITYAGDHHFNAEFYCGDAFDFLENHDKMYDYVVANGVLMNKHSASQQEFDAYAGRLIEDMFAASVCGIVFNLITPYVPEIRPYLYYRDPSEMLAFCQDRFTRRVRLDHSYPLYDYTVYLYH